MIEMRNDDPNDNNNNDKLSYQSNTRSNNRYSKNKKSIFPQKLWRLINDTRFNSAIRWSEDGRSLFIFEHPLKNICLGKENNVFCTRQPKSFIRQLHLYGFRKVDKNQFMHMYFQRGKPELVEFIKRSYKVDPSTSDMNAEPEASAKPKIDQSNSQELSTTNGGAIASANEESSGAYLDWYDGNYVDMMSYNYTDDSVFNLYNNNVYPNSHYDNYLTL